MMSAMLIRSSFAVLVVVGIVGCGTKETASPGGAGSATAPGSAAGSGTGSAAGPSARSGTGPAAGSSAGSAAKPPPADAGVAAVVDAGATATGPRPCLPPDSSYDIGYVGAEIALCDDATCFTLDPATGALAARPFAPLPGVGFDVPTDKLTKPRCYQGLCWPAPN